MRKTVNVNVFSHSHNCVCYVLSNTNCVQRRRFAHSATVCYYVEIFFQGNRRQFSDVAVVCNCPKRVINNLYANRRKTVFFFYNKK